MLWPFFNWIDDRDKKYREWELPFPFVVVARGPGKTTTRVFPLYSRAHNDTTESDFYLWPIYGCKRFHGTTLDWERTRILFYLLVDATEKNVETGQGAAPGGFFAAVYLARGIERQPAPANLRADRIAAARQRRHRAQLVAAVVAVARRGQSADGRRQPVAARGTFTAATPRRIPKNARSCSGFSSIKRKEKINGCVCCIFPCCEDAPACGRSWLK